MDKLSVRALQVLGAIDQLTKDHGRPPLRLEIARALDSSGPAIGYQLKKLKAAGLVSGRPWGRNTLELTDAGRKALQ